MIGQTCRRSLSSRTLAHVVRSEAGFLQKLLQDPLRRPGGRARRAGESIVDLRAQALGSTPDQAATEVLNDLAAKYGNIILKKGVTPC